MKTQKYVFSLFMLAVSIFLAHTAARATVPGTVEGMCKAKAKDVALQTYQTCVTEEKASRLQDIKERYKARMSEVKEQFQKELDDLNGKKDGDKAEKVEKPRKADGRKKTGSTVMARGKAQKPVPGIASSLPAKQGDSSTAQLIQAADEDSTAVVTAEPSESADTSSPEVVEVPAP